MSETCENKVACTQYTVHVRIVSVMGTWDHNNLLKASLQVRARCNIAIPNTAHGRNGEVPGPKEAFCRCDPDIHRVVLPSR